MSEFIEFLSPSALSEMEKANAELVKMVANVKSVQTEMAKITTPSGGDASVKQLTAQYQQQEKAIQALQAQVQKLTEAKQKQKSVSIEEKVVTSQQLKIDREAALAVSALTGAYQKLTLQRKQAATNLQNLIASEKASTAEIHKAQKEYDILSQKVAKADQAIGKMSMSNSLKGLTSQVSNLVGAFGVAGGVYLFAQVAKDIYQTTKQLQSLDLALRMVSGTQQEFASNQVFLTNLAEQYGIEIKGLTKNFTEFWVASKGKLEAEQIKAIFTSISKSVAIMGLSVEQQDSAFLALQQMMSKGTVQAEELKKQLGNALPGAVKAATMAYQALHPELKVTEKLFMEQMKAGKVLSAELLPELAKAYEKLYGIENVKRAETLQAAQERLANSWTQMVRNMNSSETGGISRFFKFVLDGLTELADFINLLNKDDRAISIVNESKARGEMQVLKELDSMKKSGLQTDAQLIESAKLKQDYAKKQVESYEWELNALISLGKEQAKVANDIQKKQPIGYAYRPDYRVAKSELDETNKEIKKLSSNYGFYKGVVSGTNQFLKQQNEIINTADPIKGSKAKKERIALNFKEVESEYNLRLAILERKKVDNTDDDQKSYEERLKMRLAYSEATLEIIDAQLQKELALNLLKSTEDNAKNDLALKNKEISFAQHEINKQDITNTFANKNITSAVKASDAIKAIQLGDLEFWKKIQYKKEDENLKLNKLITEGEITKYKRIVDNEKNTLLVRQAAFEKYIQLEKDLLLAQEQSDLARAKARGASQNELDSIVQSYENAIDALNNIKSPKLIAIEEIEKQMQGFIDKFSSEAGLSSFFDLLQNGLEKYGDNWKAQLVMIMESVQEMYNFISDASQANFDAEYERLEKQKNISLAFAGESASAKSEIEQQYEQRRKQIARREAKAKKEQAIFNIGIDTAQAIIATLAKTPPPAGLPLAALVAAIGAIQISMVASQKIPQYWTGTDNAEGGLAWTQERGREIITDSQGRIKSTGSDKGAELTMLSKGDKVFNAEKSAMMFDNSLNSMLLNNGIVMPKIEVSMDTQILGSKLDKLSDTIASKESFSITRDAKGERIYQRNQNERKELLNNILNVRTYGV
jgi:tape measure domain-containing protein